MDKQQEIELDRRLRNWAAWSRSGMGARATCGSAERRFVPPRDDDETRADVIAREPINVTDAELLERALLRLQRWIDRKLLTRYYLNGDDDKSLASFLNCRPFMVRPYLLMAMGSLQCVIDHMPIDGMRARNLQSKGGSNMYRLPPTKELPAP